MVVRRGCLFLSFFLKRLLVFSSSVHTFWLLFSFLFSLALGVLYMGVYYAVLLFLFNAHGRKNVAEGGFSYLLFLVLLGMPPFPIFFLKWVVLAHLLFFNILLFLLAMVAML